MINQIDILEKKINSLITQIKIKKITPAESGIGKFINQMKSLDEPCYNKKLKEYTQVLNDIKNSTLS